jgi:single-strand DNA-binding protein
MSFSVSKVHLIGRLGQDPSMRYTSNGQAVTTFSVATDRPAKPGAKAETDWHSVTCFERLAEVSGQYLSRGRLVYVAGRLQYRSFEAKDGTTRRVAEIVATEVILLDRKPEPDLHVAPSSKPDDDLPF